MARKKRRVHPEEKSPCKDGPLGQGHCHEEPTPWVSASEMLPDHTDEQKAVDEVEEASMESFPCSDPPAYVSRHP